MSVRRERARLLISSNRWRVYTSDRVKQSKEGESGGVEKKISCQLFLHKILEISLL